ncbi:MAG: NAD+ synthase [Acidimicrobiia bacterium]
MPRVRVVAAQINVTVGDLSGNAGRILSAYEQAEAVGADLVAFPELAVTGYPPEDLLLRPAFAAAAAETLEKIAARTNRTTAVIGFPEPGRDLFNAAAICCAGRVCGVYRKHVLPNYTVFDERRYFSPPLSLGPLFVVGGARVGISICEDLWDPAGPVAAQAAGGAELLISINASPYAAGRLEERVAMLSTRAADASTPLVYVNLVGGQDELVFDGASLAFDEEGRLVARARQFEEDLLVVDVEVRPVFRKRLMDPRGRASAPRLPEVEVSSAGGHGDRDPAPTRLAPALEPDEEVFQALVTGTRDYVRKNGFSEAVVGLSGGIDSSLVAAIAVEALGPHQVVGVLMPSRYSSQGSRDDAAVLASSIGIRTLTVPIEEAHVAFSNMLVEPFGGTFGGTPEENLQARVRGTVLMALSNQFGWLVLTTGNKSEMATGYSTLYGDLAGGFALIKDVFKTAVYRLARHVNRRAGRELIPRAVLEKAPSAELRPDQRDEDTLPPYALLDLILARYVEGDQSIAELEEAGFPSETVRQVALMVDRSEYKRRQAPPGIRVSPKAFGKDRRLPITNRWPG